MSIITIPSRVRVGIGNNYDWSSHRRRRTFRYARSRVLDLQGQPARFFLRGWRQVSDAIRPSITKPPTVVIDTPTCDWVPRLACRVWISGGCKIRRFFSIPISYDHGDFPGTFFFLALRGEGFGSNRITPSCRRPVSRTSVGGIVVARTCNKHTVSGRFRLDTSSETKSLSKNFENSTTRISHCIRVNRTVNDRPRQLLLVLLLQLFVCAVK